jgi:hypothetical protein
MQDLKKWFDKAKVPVKIERYPINSMVMVLNNQDIFQMSIDTRGKKNRREYFRIYYGHSNNEVRVIDIDSKLQQAILQVKEPKRTYMVKTWNRERKEWQFQPQQTPDFLRNYLMGMDESHLFIAELPNNLGPINKIKDAHKALKPKIVLKNKKNFSKIKRQGEWFFIPATSEENELIGENLQFIEKKIPLGNKSWRNRNSHIADELVDIQNDVYVKGKITHIEHKTLKLHGWFKVMRNNEARSSVVSGTPVYDGVKYVD